MEVFEFEKKIRGLDLKITKKKEKNQELKIKNAEFSAQISNLLSLIQKNDPNYNNFYKREEMGDRERLKPNYLSEKQLSLKKGENKLRSEKNFYKTKEKLDDYTELEKYALEIINEFD